MASIIGGVVPIGILLLFVSALDKEFPTPIKQIPYVLDNIAYLIRDMKQSRVEIGSYYITMIEMICSVGLMLKWTHLE